MSASRADVERFKKLADLGRCDYCGGHGWVKPDPFGQHPACAECWFLIIDGDDDD